VGWRERDWARLNEAERAELLGPGPSRFAGAGAGEVVGSSRHVRRWVWGSVAVLALAVFGVAFAVRPAQLPGTGTGAPQPSVLFGIKGPTVPGGSDTVCTEMAIAASDGRWQCLSWLINTHHLPVITPRAYSGPCAYLVMDQQRGRWTCLSSTPPQPDSTQPAPAAPPAPDA
jgi:hypothetical protein